VTTTIPELANVRADKFGMHLTTIDQEDVGIGDSQERFSIQSISKALTVALAFSFLDEVETVGVEPSGTAFNSLVQLEYEKESKKSFINAGAM
jgi:glutaminase